MKVHLAATAAILLAASCGDETASAEQACTKYLALVSVQLTDVTVSAEDSDGVAVLSGTVVRSFNGPFAVGDSASVPLVCSTESSLMGLGGTTYDCASAAASPVVELGLEAAEDGYQIANVGDGGPPGVYSGLVRLDAPTEEPRFWVSSACPWDKVLSRVSEKRGQACVPGDLSGWTNRAAAHNGSALHRRRRAFGGDIPAGPPVGASLILRPRDKPERILSMALPEFTMRQLLEAGVHFGHQTARWNPRMQRYIYGSRNGIHILDLTQTVPMLDRRCRSSVTPLHGAGASCSSAPSGRRRSRLPKRRKSRRSST